MHQRGEFVNYGTQGVCLIEDIRPIRPGKSTTVLDYYVLRPLYQERSTVYVPVDSPELAERMHPVLSPEEIDQTILSVKGKALPYIGDRKERSACFRQILSQRDQRELLLLASCLHTKAQENPKGLSASDAQALKAAEAAIEQEFAFSLRMNAQDVGSYIREKLGLNTTSGIGPDKSEREEHYEASQSSLSFANTPLPAE